MIQTSTKSIKKLEDKYVTSTKWQLSHFNHQFQALSLWLEHLARMFCLRLTSFGFCDFEELETGFCGIVLVCSDHHDCKQELLQKTQNHPKEIPWFYSTIIPRIIGCKSSQALLAFSLEGDRFFILLFVSSYIFPHDFRTHLLYMYEDKILFSAFLLTTTCWPHQSGATSGVASTWILAWEAALFLGQQLNLSPCLICFFLFGWESGVLKSTKSNGWWFATSGLQQILIINKNHPRLKRNWPMRWSS